MAWGRGAQISDGETPVIFLKVVAKCWVEENRSMSEIALIMVSAHGLKENANANDVQSVVTQDDLFC